MALKQKLSLWLPVLLWCGLIYYLSDQPYLKITEAWYDLILRKIAHMFEYAILTLLIQRALKGSTRWTTKRVCAAAFILAVAYAASDEFHQTFVPGRVGCLKDVLIDTVGIALATSLWHRLIGSSE